ncbi:hypothetical protein A3Q56_07806 [Intoshia linei]|uniref:Uncharacterized protein n=1 Tax=Intoshia linei TaxID=1819745 RepID=A0A177ARN3_9BILA|nr:hypothetical protein A3Q56_07806 [Intoshia linei]
MCIWANNTINRYIQIRFSVRQINSRIFCIIQQQFKRIQFVFYNKKSIEILCKICKARLL